MAKRTPIINIFTYSLPYVLANQIYNEFQDRFKEANYIIEHYQRYTVMKEYIKTVELLLALSIFYKRVIANLDGAIKFHGRVTRNSDTEVISIGSYDLNGQEKNKILGVLINYQKLIDRFQITPDILNYNLTIDFLKGVKRLQSDLEDQDFLKKRKNNGKNSTDSEEDIPF